MVSHKTEINALSSEEIQQIELFKERALELDAILIKYQNTPISKHANSINPVERVSTFEANTPDIDHIANMAMKFRFFYADKEPTQFEKVIGLLRRKAKDEWAINYIDRISIWYKQSMAASDTTGQLGKPIPNREILNLWFNSKFFHSDLQKRAKLDQIHSLVGEYASFFQFYTAIVRCASHVDSLYLVVHQLTCNNFVICTPSHHFRRGQNT